MLKKIISNTVAQVWSKATTALIAIFTVWLMTNYLTVNLYGTFSKLYNYMSIFSFLVDLGLYSLTVKKISTDMANASKTFSNILTLRLICWILVMIIALWCAFFLPWYNSNIELWWIFILWFFVLFSLLNSSFMALMQAHMKMEFSFISVTVGKIVNLVLLIVWMKFLFPLDQINWDFFWPFMWIMMTNTLGIFVNMVMNYFYANKIMKIKFWYDWKMMKSIFKEALPFWIALFLSVVYTKIDVVFLSFMESKEVAEKSIALYSLPLKIMDVMLVSWSFFLNSLLPSLSQSYKDWNFKKIQDIAYNAVKVLFMFSIMIVSMGMVFKDSIILLIANESYLLKTDLNQFTSSHAFTIALLISLFFYIWTVFSYVLVACDRQKKLLIISIILTVVNMIGNVILIPKLSFVWSWIATIITQIIFMILRYLYARKVVQIPLPVKFIIINIFTWFLMYFVTKYLVVNFDLWSWWNFVYWWIIAAIYVLTFWVFEYKLYKKALKE